MFSRSPMRGRTAMTRRNVMFIMFLTLTLVVENLAMSEFTDPGSIVKMGQHTSSTTELSRDQEGTVRPSRALVRNGRHGCSPLIMRKS
ncbi:hypothetical protein KEM48_002343 [Puccinia striiformis f. sp. tritici PST-130]|nr:hypothetical protein KEM48_002343 [Puccinia striiformis f. sp. tritici PST-130]